MPRPASRSLPRRLLHSGRPRRHGWRRLIPTWRFGLFSTVTVLLLGAGFFALGVALVKVPDAHAAATAQRNTWLYRDGTVLAQTGQTNRQSVSLDQISTEAQHAILAAEDRDFYREGAVNPAALLRAGWNTATGKGAQGGSTITQQYVKNAYLTQQRTVSRKVKEIFIAIKVDATLSKEEILASYLNTTYYGRGAYGIQAAAQAYFGVDASQLNAAQGAYLATLLNAPSAYDVSSATEAGKRAATGRWNYVLDGMVQEGWLPAADRAAITFPQVRAPQPALGLSGQAGYLVDAAKEYLLTHQLVDEAALARGGYRITLSLDPARQADLQTAVQRQLTDKLDAAKRPGDGDIQAGAVSVDPKTGGVLAMYGGTTTPSTSSTTPPAATTRPVRPSSRSRWPPRWRAGRRPRTGGPSPPTPSTTAPTAARCAAVRQSRRTRRRTRARPSTARSRCARPPTGRSTPPSPNSPRTPAWRRSSRARSRSACPPTPTS